MVKAVREQGDESKCVVHKIRHHRSLSPPSRSVSSLYYRLERSRNRTKRRILYLQKLNLDIWPPIWNLIPFYTQLRTIENKNIKDDLFYF